jgi:hypothetical protein
VQPQIKEPFLEMPDHEVEDPLNLLGSDDELEAEGVKKKKPLLTQMVLKQKQEQR